jgi:uncharacterized protein (DUF342 family)
MPEVPQPAASSPGGAAPSAPADAYIEMKAEPARVTLLVKSSVVKDSIKLNKEDVAAKLQILKVVHEVVDWNAVENILANKLYDRTHIIAAAVPAKPGKDAFVEEKIKIDADVKPVVREDGKADYRNVDNIHQVKKGDVLAVKHPAVPGQQGIDCLGKQTPVAAVKDVQLKAGANTEITPDGMQLVASTGGYVYHQAGTICVGVTFVLKGDVDFTTGNLKYQGDITIAGGVTDGFTVEASGDIIVEGNVDAAEVISRNGSVTVKAGIFGHGKGRITARKNIHVQSAQDIHLECGESLIVDKGMRNCHVVAGDIKADKASCTIVGGTIKSYGNAFIFAMGAEGCRTEIRLADKVAEQAKAGLDDINKKKAQAAGKVEMVAKRLKGMKAMAEKFGTELSERARADLKAVLDVYAALNRVIKDADTEKEILLKQLNAPGRHTGRCVIADNVHSGGFLDIYGHIRELREEDGKKEWVWAPDGLVSRTIIPEAETPKPSGPLPG